MTINNILSSLSSLSTVLLFSISSLFFYANIFLLLPSTINTLPSINETSQEPIIASPGEDAYIDCKVDNLESHTVLWKSINLLRDSSNGKLLTAGKVRVTSDQRLSVIHHSGN